MTYVPPLEILEKYADVMVNFALGKTKGIKKGDKVMLTYDKPAADLAYCVYAQIIKSGGHPIVRQNDYKFSKIKFEYSTDEQLDYTPEGINSATIEAIDHRISLMADEDPQYLKDVDPKKIFRSQNAFRKFKKEFYEKVDAGKLSWTLCLYGTEAQAALAGLSLEEYWDQITKACYLEEADPVAKWKSAYKEIDIINMKLNDLCTQASAFRVVSEHTDLTIQIGENRKFLSGSGANIPSFELFTSPDWRGTNGHIYFDRPLNRFGNVISGIYLEFKDGIVTKATAKENEELLLAMIAQKNANKIGEFSLTDKRFSKIDRYMAETLFDENYGGEFGNTHIALGNAYREAHTGDITKFDDTYWEKMGFNESIEHTDIIASEDRKVYAIFPDKESKLIYEHGEFIL